MEEENKSKSNVDPNIKTIHTYTSDMADAVRTNEASVIKIAMAEKEKRDQEAIYKQARGTGVTKFFWAFGGFIFLVAAAVGLYFFFKSNPSVVSVSNNAPVVIGPLISYDDQSSIDLSKAESASGVANAISTDMQKVGKPGSIKSLLLITSANGKSEPMSLQDLLSLMKVSAPSTLIRTLGDEYMVGTYTGAGGNTKSNSHLFVLLQVKDFNQAYAAMLNWEKTMLDDFYLLFHVDVSGDRSTLFAKPWKDIIINNKDARILYDTEGNDILYYIFADENHLIITDSKEAIKEISVRLLNKATKPL